MPLTITRILIEGIKPETPNQSVTLRDAATNSVLGTGMCDGAGRFSILAPFALFLQAIAAGHADASGLYQQADTATGAAPGKGGASGTLGQALPISGAAGGHGAASGGPSQPVAGAAAGQGGATATPTLTLPGSQGGTAGGDAEATGALSVNVPLGGAAGGHASAGPSTQAQDGPHLGAAAAGAGGASGTVTQGKALAGTAAGVGGASASGLTVGGSAVSVSDNFTRANSPSSLGTGWAVLSGLASFGVSANQAAASGASGNVRTETFANAQYAEAKVVMVPGMANHGAGVVVRASGTTYYVASGDSWDVYGDGSAYNLFVKLWKVVSGTWTELGLWTWQAGVASDWFGSGGLIVRLEANGTALSVLAGSTHGSLTSRITATDSAITSGAPGIYSEGLANLDDFYAGDL